MRMKIIRIGNSQGIRIPKVLLEQSRLGTEVDLVVENEMIVIRPAARPREGWGEKFRRMSENGDVDTIDDLGVQTEWDKD